ncbi:hypothetical protein C8J24_3219 [Sphingomonas aerolata]|uniref:Uncharacterized protein n=1 Tax=Sphingomonas aerolata TaxID=185951 RepID=A0A2T4YNL4_9SPHN|nr:hypothetical protein [Sphingomonas aerolata]PTM45002.1 hypothetical protein C8J24_3219 [Sphingomonas aerolata]
MLKIRTKRQGMVTARALDRLVAVETSVNALGDEDLLDLADIFAVGEVTPLREMAQAEMRRRALSL